MLPDYERADAGAKACASPEAFRSLAAAPTGVMLNQFALGAGVLVWTEHSVLAGPYHRNITGTMTTINALRSRSGSGARIIAASAADYVLVCPASPETRFYAAHGATALRRRRRCRPCLARGDHPDWLAPVDLGESPLRLYRVIR